MRFVPYVYDAGGQRVDVDIVPMSQADAERTDAEPLWQSSWTSEFLQAERLKRYAVKRGEELIALGAYEVHKDALVVYIIYMESQPQSNPTIAAERRKYSGISHSASSFPWTMASEATLFFGPRRRNSKNTMSWISAR